MEILQYELKVEGKQSIFMPAQAKVLTVQMRHEKPCIWVEVNPEYAPEFRIFETFYAGQKMIEDMGVERKYIGTYQINDGVTCHVYERK